MKNSRFKSIEFSSQLIQKRLKLSQNGEFAATLSSIAIMAGWQVGGREFPHAASSTSDPENETEDFGDGSVELCCVRERALSFRLLNSRADAGSETLAEPKWKTIIYSRCALEP